MMSNYWSDKRVCVTGGAQIIGSHLVKELLKHNPKDIWVVDNLSAGKVGNVPPQVRLMVKDLREYEAAYSALSGADVVFHMACTHGGRGFVDTHKTACFDNFSLDATVFRAAKNAGVSKVIFSSSACAYPVHIQTDRSQVLKLSEGLQNWREPTLPDGAYGWAKLMGEMTLDSYAEQGSLQGISTRSFTVYGPRMNFTHAIAALILKTHLRQDPLEIWGDGQQIRNWTFVEDNVRGARIAAENMDRGVVNIGTEERLTPLMAAEYIWEIMGWKPENINYKLDAPTGPLNRVADASKLHGFGWRPQVEFKDGLRKTIEWFLEEIKYKNYTMDELSTLLTER